MIWESSLKGMQFCGLFGRQCNYLREDRIKEDHTCVHLFHEYKRWFVSPWDLIKHFERHSHIAETWRQKWDEAKNLQITKTTQKEDGKRFREDLSSTSLEKRYTQTHSLSSCLWNVMGVKHTINSFLIYFCLPTIPRIFHSLCLPLETSCAIRPFV